MSAEDSKHPQVKDELQPLLRKVLTPASADADPLPPLEAPQLQPVLRQEPTSAAADAESIPVSPSSDHAQAPEPEAAEPRGSVSPHAQQSGALTASPAESEDDTQTPAPLRGLPAPDAAVEHSSRLQQPQAVCSQEPNIVAAAVDLPPLPPQPPPLRRQGSGTGQDDPTSASPPPTMLHPKESQERVDALSQTLSGREPTSTPADVDCIPLPPLPCSMTEQRERQRTCSATDMIGPSGSSMQHAPRHELHTTAAHEMGSAAPAFESPEWAGAYLSTSHAGSTIPVC